MSDGSRATDLRPARSCIIVVIRRNGIDREVGNDNLRDPGQKHQLSSGLFVVPISHQNFLSKPAGGKAASGIASATQTGAENSSQLIHNGRRRQEYIAVFQGRSPNVKRVASPVGEGRNRDIGVENDPKSLWQWSYSATPSRSRFSKFSKLPGRCREGGVFNTGC